MSYEELAARLDAVMPEGLCILSAAPAVCKAGMVDRAVYRVTLDCPVEAVETLLAKPSVTAQKRTKKKELVTVELKPVLDAANNTLIPLDDGVVWEMTLPCNSTQSVNPSLVIAALKTVDGAQNVTCAIRRLRVLTADGNEFA